MCVWLLCKVFKLHFRAAQAPKGVQIYSVHHLIPAGEEKVELGYGTAM